jgi:hypothetical protein
MSESPITAVNFCDAAPVPTPDPGTGIRSTTVTELAACSGDFYFAMRVIDDAENESDLSNLPTAATVCDTVRPAAVTLGITRGKTTLVVDWTASGDDSLTGGFPTLYDLRQSTSPITAENFDSATVVSTPPPDEAETCVTIMNLPSCSTDDYYFAMIVRDDVGNASAMSNVAHAKTKCFGADVYCNLEPEGERVEAIAAPLSLTLSTPFQSVARGKVLVRFGVPVTLADQVLDLSVYDVLGRRVATLTHGPAIPGWRTLTWDTGAPPRACGVYFARLSLASEVRTSRVLVLR